MRSCPDGYVRGTGEVSLCGVVLGPVSERVAINRKLRLIASCTQFAIELRLISIVRLITTLYETGPRWGVVLVGIYVALGSCPDGYIYVALGSCAGGELS